MAVEVYSEIEEVQLMFKDTYMEVNFHLRRYLVGSQFSPTIHNIVGVMLSVIGTSVTGGHIILLNNNHLFGDNNNNHLFVDNCCRGKFAMARV